MQMLFLYIKNLKFELIYKNIDITLCKQVCLQEEKHALV